jgi:hypothetical protein
MGIASDHENESQRPEVTAVVKRLVPLGVATVIGGAATLAWLGVGREQSPSASLEEAPVGSPMATAEGALPADHPPIGNGAAMMPTAGMALPPNHPAIGGGSPQGGMVAPSDEAPALGWKMPADWQEAPSPSRLRLATYRIPGGAEMSVARAGGTTEANIQRWISQFDNAGADTREERTIHGLHVTLVQVAGTYEPSPTMMAGAPPEAHPGWALQGAIVETAGDPYFFKLLGPASALQAARPSFERLLQSLTPLVTK